MRIGSLLLLVLLACSTPSKKDGPVESEIPASFQAILDAHGGLDKWKAAKTLSFSMGEELYTIDMDSRMTRVEMPEKTFGFNGQEVWVTPDSGREGNEEFMYNLFFYFFGMPFVLADPGVQFEGLDPMVYDSISYNAIEVTFEEGIGNSPKDEYIILSDPETNQMKWLMYKATFGAQQAGERFNLVRYAKWERVNGVLLPQVIEWTAYEGESTTGVQDVVQFEKVTLSDKKMEPGFWEKPTQTSPK